MNNSLTKNHNTIIAIILSTIGFLYLLYYIFRASTDVIASDYIRVINYYVNDVTDLKYLFSWEGISRIPFAYLARFINVKFFNYSVYFDKVLGITGLFIFNFVTVKYTLENISHKVLRIVASIIITFISFSLMAWEMILNGTGYPHFITIGLIALTFKLAATAPVVASFAILILIIITSLLFAGSYAVGFLATLIFFAIVGLIVRRKSVWASSASSQLKQSVRASYVSPLLILIISIICLMLYFKSSSTGEQLLPVGFQDITLKELLINDILFPIKFLICSFASALIGVETLTFAATVGTMSMKHIYIFGIIYLMIFLYAFYIIVKKLLAKPRVGESYASQSPAGTNGPEDHSQLTNLSEDHNDVGASYASPDLFIYYYIIYGLVSFALVFLARYRFVRVDYGMSSRYAIQYMFLTIGILLTLFKHIDTRMGELHAPTGKATSIGEPHDIVVDATCMGELREPVLTKKNILSIIISAFFIFVITFGHIITTEDEIFKSENRKLIYGYIENIAINYHDYSDEELMRTFEYFRNPEHIKNALKILEDRKLNVFSPLHFK